MATPSAPDRRAFLSRVTTTVTGTIALAATASVVNATPVIDIPVVVEKKEPLPAVQKGYQRTEHVDTYYHLADF
ncbi:MAG: Tat pathway signal protein [Gammaproteobacteria bacterium]|nr:MAG: Tat pathway signal protein [Gammaproteobacteria bacterium]